MQRWDAVTGGLERFPTLNAGFEHSSTGNYKREAIFHEDGKKSVSSSPP